MWPFPKKVQEPSPGPVTDQELARRLLEMAAQLLGLTSSGPSTANSSRSPRPLPPTYQKRGLEAISVVTRSRRVALQWEEARTRLPQPISNPTPTPPDQQSSGKAVSGGFATTTNASPPTGSPAGTDAPSGNAR